MVESVNTKELFYDPFAPEGQELFDPLTAFASMWERYKNGEVEHDDAADIFLADTQALMMDATFLGRFSEAQSIAASMHALCNDDHQLAQSLLGNESVSTYLDSFNSHDGHSHDSHSKDEKEDDDIDPKTGKRRAKIRFSLLRFLGI